MGSSTSTVSPGEGTATGRLVWVTGKKGSVVFIVLCLREPPPHPSDLIWYHSLFSIPKVSEGFLSFFFLLKHMSLLMIIWKIGKSHSEPKGVPEGQILILTWSHRSVWWSLGVFSLLCVCCRRFMAQECFKRNIEAMPRSKGVFSSDFKILDVL